MPPQKEQTVTHNLRQPSIATQSPIGRNILDAGDGTDEIESPAGPRIPPPVEPALLSPTRRDTQPSVSIEQAAKPTFDISVGDPHKVGDLTSSHIVYLVKTKVSGPSALQPSSSLKSHRRLQKLIGSPNFRSPEDTEISYGYITHSIRITPE